MLSTKLKEAAGNGADATLYVDDVFSTYLYTGDGGYQVINNGIDLAGKGGLVWMKGRSGTYGAYNHSLHDTQRGLVYRLSTNNTDAQSNAPSDINSFNSNGFTLGGGALTNDPSTTYASWTFRKAAKFFDVVTYTGANAAQTIPHNLGSTPGCVIIKCTNVGGTSWWVRHRSVPGNAALLNSTAPFGFNINDLPAVSSTALSFPSGGQATNQSSETYVAYLFAHDTSSTGIIQCGSYTGNGSATGPTVNLGWEPQYVLIKDSTSAFGWTIQDTMRGMSLTDNAYLYANLANAEANAGTKVVEPTATGFTINVGSNLWNASGDTFIYMAIRRPNKPPTSGTQVFNAIARTGTGAAATVTGVGFSPDMLISENKSSPEGWMANRLAAFSNTAARYLFTPYTSAETAVTSATSGVMLDGATTGTVSLTAGANLNSSGQLYVDWFFKRAPGFFDEVCYTGSASTLNVNHNLGVVPELIIAKTRSTTSNWMVYSATLGNAKALLLNDTSGQVSQPSVWNSTTPTSTIVTLGGGSQINSASVTSVMYLFATLAGISKVGSYTGNGTTQAINCGFAAGARFVLIKRTDSTGDWFVWDTARGIVAANDPHLSLNTTAAEVTTDDSVDPYAAGFAVNQVAATNINVSSATYIFLAIA